MSKLVFIKIKTHHGTEFNDLSGELKDYLRRKYPEETEKSYNSNAGLIPELGRVVCVTLGYETEKDPVTVTITGNMSEHELLMNLAEMLRRVQEKGYQLIGYNINHFDSIYLVKRFIINKIRVPEILKNSFRWTRDNKNTDLLESWRLGENAVPLELAALSIGNKFKERYNTSNLKLTEIDFNRLKLECESDIKTMIDINALLNNYLW